MKKFIVTLLFATFLVAGDVFATDLTGVWVADNYCVPGDDPNDPLVPKYEESRMEITQSNDFIVSVGITPQLGEICGGVVDGNDIHLTCQGTFFIGELQKNKFIVGINYVTTDGATCTAEARRAED